jgi:hypothetical protein
MSKHIPYGIRYGKRVTIDQISPSERGSRCDCTCELCGHPLIAAFSDHETTRPHFRHQRGYLHCHFDVDEGMMNLIFEILERLEEEELIDIVNSGLEQFSIKDKVQIPRNYASNKQISTPLFIRKDKKEIQFRIIIETEEFVINIVTKKAYRLKPEEKIRYLNIADLIHKAEAITQDQIRSIVKQLVGRLKERSQAILSMNKWPIFEEGIEYIKDSANEKLKLHGSIQPDFRDLTVRDGHCPLCKKGKIVKKFSKLKEKPFFGCSNYPECKYVHQGSEYYDDELRKWVFLD